MAFASASRTAARIPSRTRPTALKQTIRYSSSQPHGPHADEVQELAKTLNGMLRNRGWGAQNVHGQAFHPHFYSAWHQMHGRRRSIFWPLLLIGGGVWAYTSHKRHEEARLDMEMALAKAKARGDFQEAEQKLAAYKHCNGGWHHRGSWGRREQDDEGNSSKAV